MKVLVVKPKMEIYALRTELILKKHGIDYEVYSISNLTDADEMDEVKDVVTDDESQKAGSDDIKVSKLVKEPVENQAELVDPFADFANVNDEPENLGKDFLKAQLSTKNQMKIRNVLAIISAVAVVIAFILEKLGVI